MLSILSMLSMLSMLFLLLYGSLYKYNIDLYFYYHIFIVTLLLSNPGFYIILYIINSYIIYPLVNKHRP